MTPETSPITRTTLLRVATITWLTLISAAVIINHVSLSKQMDQSAEKAPMSLVNELDGRVTELTAWVEEQDQQQAISLPAARYESDRQSLDQRLTAIEQILHKQVTTQDLQELQQRIEQLEKRPAATSQATQPKAVAPSRKPNPPKPVAPPFQVIGIELRGSERFLLLLPTGLTSLAQTRLIRPGETEAGWQLNSIIDGENAVFQKDAHVHRLVIPQHRERP